MSRLSLCIHLRLYTFHFTLSTENESSKFWLSVLTELQNRGVKDIFIACVDGLTGFPAAIETVFPKTQIQLCIVHMVRNSLNYVSWKHRKSVAADLRKIYTALNAAEAELALVDFAEKWDNLYPTISKSWLSHWTQVIPLVVQKSRNSLKLRQK